MLREYSALAPLCQPSIFVLSCSIKCRWYIAAALSLMITYHEWHHLISMIHDINPPRFPCHFAAMNIDPLKPPNRCRFFPAQFPTAAVSWSHRIEFLSSFFLCKKLRHVDVQALRWAWPFGTHHLWTLCRTPGRFLWRNEGIWRIENDIPMISRWIRGECEQVFQKHLVFMTGEALHHYRHCGSKASCHWPSLSSEIWWDLTLMHISKAFLFKAWHCSGLHQFPSKYFTNIFHIYYI